MADEWKAITIILLFYQPGKLDYLSKQLKSPSLLSRTLTKKSDDRTTNNEIGHKNNTLKEKPKQTSSTDTFGNLLQHFLQYSITIKYPLIQ